MSESSPRVLFYFDQSELNDSTLAVIALLDALDKEKFPFRCLLPSYEGPLAKLLRSRGHAVDAIEFPLEGGILKKGLGYLAYFRKLFRYFRMYSFDLVHGAGLKADLLSIAFKIRFNTPLFWHLWAVLPSGFSLWGFRWAAAIFSDHIIASSLLAAHQMGRSLRWRERLSVLYRGYEAAGPVPASIVHAKPRVIAMAGALAPWRGDKTFLRAMELVRREHPDCKGIVFERASEGDYPEYREEILALLDELGFGESVRIERLEAGISQKEFAERLAGANVSIFVAESVSQEPFDGGVAEAMGAGMAVIVSRSGVLPELILHETTGLLVTPGDANALAAAIQRLFADQKLCRQISGNAIQEFNSRFSIAKYAAAIEKLYATQLDLATDDDQKGADADSGTGKKAA